ncbi:sigma factor-like helix-turn-helix DNA-binding protein [Actinomadura sp. 9N215]|uniref:sigma factor-like helix-turn-helix DNA-binding protein n=1 Tax=Actinomadura sp. 9N215 TaxID=3375150 RepID=UPI00378BF946
MVERDALAEQAEMADSLSMAFVVLLETLSPVERAVFMLREVFGYSYPDVAAITGRNELDCRQIFADARQRIAAGERLRDAASPPSQPPPPAPRPSPSPSPRSSSSSSPLSSPRPLRALVLRADGEVHPGKLGPL